MIYYNKNFIVIKKNVLVQKLYAFKFNQCVYYIVYNFN